MPNIKTGGVDLSDVAICPQCPGGAKIYPASALAAHVASSHSGYDSSSRVCENCGERFTHNVNTNPDFTFILRCKKCRGVKRGKKRGPKPRHKKKASAAMQFADSIPQHGTRR